MNLVQLAKVAVNYKKLRAMVLEAGFKDLVWPPEITKTSHLVRGRMALSSAFTMTLLPGLGQ